MVIATGIHPQDSKFGINYVTLSKNVPSSCTGNACLKCPFRIQNMVIATVPTRKLFRSNQMNLFDGGFSYFREFAILRDIVENVHSLPLACSSLNRWAAKYISKYLNNIFTMLFLNSEHIYTEKYLQSLLMNTKIVGNVFC